MNLGRNFFFSSKTDALDIRVIYVMNFLKTVHSNPILV